MLQESYLKTNQCNVFMLANQGHTPEPIDSKIAQSMRSFTWQMWTEEYSSIIHDAIVLLNEIQSQRGQKLTLDLVEFSNFINHETWLLRRACRFVRFMRRKYARKRKNTKCSIHSLIIVTRMAAAFLKVSCLKYHHNIKEKVKRWDKIDMFLNPVLSGGFTFTQPDSIKISNSTNLNLSLLSNEDIWNEIKKKSTASSNTTESLAADSHVGYAPKEMKKQKKMFTFGLTMAKFFHGIKDETEEEEVEVEEKKIEVPKLTRIPLPWEINPHCKVQPIIGWSKSGLVKSANQWRDPRSCCFCHTCGDDDDACVQVTCSTDYNSTANDCIDLDLNLLRGCGRLLPLSGGNWVHAACAVWSSEVWESPEDNLLRDVDKARHRGSKLKCFGCGRPGMFYLLHQ